MNTIKHANIIYMPHISPLGGIETYVYEMVKKYKDLDIAVVSKVCDKLQAQRIRKYCRLYIHKDQKIECDVAIINYDISIIDYINKEAKIYETIHADYSNRMIYKRIPPTHDRITGYIAITEYLKDKVKELIKKDNVIMSYNPLTIEEEEKPLILVSATRLHKNKGKERMQKLATALDNAEINYLWYVITNDTVKINSPNVIFIKNRLDIDKWLAQANYGVLLSDSEACSYFINEVLYRNIPIITTPLPYLKEIGVEDGKNAYILNFDCSNINEVVKKIRNVPFFNFVQLKDKYNNIFAESKSNYEEERKMKYLVEATEKYEQKNIYDAELSVEKRVERYIPKKGEQWEVSYERKEILEEKGFVKTIKEIKNKSTKKNQSSKKKTTTKKENIENEIKEKKD